MILDFEIHPDALKSLEDLRPTLMSPDGKTPRYASVEEMLIDDLREGITKAAIQRHPPVAMAVMQEQFNAAIAEELTKRIKPVKVIEAEPVIVKSAARPMPAAPLPPPVVVPVVETVLKAKKK